MRSKKEKQAVISTRISLLAEEFKDGPPEKLPYARGNGEYKPRARISCVQKLFVQYRYAQGYSARRIALELDISESSAKRIVTAAHYDPEQFVFTDFVVPVNVSNGTGYMCRYCGWMAESKPDAAHHAFGHLWDEDELRVAPRGYL